MKFSANIDPSQLGLNGIDDADSKIVFELFQNEITSMSASASNIIVLSGMTRADSNALMSLMSAHNTSVINTGPNFHDLVTTQYKQINF